MAGKILIVEDERTLLETLEHNLKKQGYVVDTAENGLDALEIARSTRPDVIILDIMLPGMDGFEVCGVLRQEMNTPILMLTARGDKIDSMVGVEVNADEYLTKPFSMREFLARIKTLLRRARLIREELNSQDAYQLLTPIYTFDDLVLDTGRREVKLKSIPVPLKPKEFELLSFLIRHRGQVISREYILERVWGWDYIGDSRTVDVHIRWLREKIEVQPSKPVRIITVRGAGYRFEG